MYIRFIEAFLEELQNNRTKNLRKFPQVKFINWMELDLNWMDWKFIQQISNFLEFNIHWLTPIKLIYK